MYHYVRDLKNSKYPDIKGIDISEFKEQINYFRKHYHFITMEELIFSVDNKKSLPEKSILLTFDDAYIDHYVYVYPILDEFKIQGSFYPPAKAITEHKVLDVNKIHYLLAAVKDTDILLREIKLQLKIFKEQFNLSDFEFYYNKLAIKDRYDSKDIIFIKRLLQVELNEGVRQLIINKLFQKIIDIDENTFSRQLYMDIDQIKCMKRNGMHIGSHGYDHYWLGSLSLEQQKEEILKSLNFLSKIGADMNSWTMCYPYGNYNNDTLKLLEQYKCKLALTTDVNVTNLENYHKYKLPRLDTNDFPKNSNDTPNLWYFKS
jgi:peptidoglycan/xylan/chitin deacetylase (PgdA/CDA1 family)